MRPQRVRECHSDAMAASRYAVVARLHSFGGEWSSLSCPDSNHCVAVGGGPGQEPPFFAEVMTSSDGGLSWTEQRPPSGVLGLGAVDCPSVSRCYAIGLALLPPKQQTQLTNDIAVLLESVDGGRLWRRVGAAPGLVDLNAISCPEVTTCFAAGDTVTGEDGSSDAVVVTTNGGTRWHEEAGACGAVGHSVERHLLSERVELLGGRGVRPFGDDRRRAHLAATRLGLGRFAELSERTALRRDGRQRRRGLGARGTGLRDRFVTGSAPAFWPGSSEVCPSATVCIAAGSTGEALSRATAFVSHDGGRNGRTVPSLPGRHSRRLRGADDLRPVATAGR